MMWLENGTLSLLAAPPAWGKTSLLLNLIPSCKRTVVFVSPLKALALEFCDRLNSEGFNVFYVKSQRHLQDNLRELCHYQVVILSYEHAMERFTTAVERNKDQFFLVFDEFHLLFQWGGSFRPSLWEFFYQMAETGCPALGLSATLDQNLLEEVKNSFGSCFDRIQLVDEGNFTLKKGPQKTFLMKRPSELWIHLGKSLAKRRRSLVFLPYRQQVKHWCEKLLSQQINALGCVGGETVEFRQHLKNSPDVEVILSTHALSHGVNLPPLDDIFIGHPVDDAAMWLQMVGRGGREGGDYNLYCLNTHGQSVGQRMLARTRNTMGLVFSWQRV